MDTYMHKTMVRAASLENIEIISSEEFMVSEVRLKFLKKMIILGPKTAILGPQSCRILVLGPHFWWSGGTRAPGVPPGSTLIDNIDTYNRDRAQITQSLSDRLGLGQNSLSGAQQVSIATKHTNQLTHIPEHHR